MAEKCPGTERECDDSCVGGWCMYKIDEKPAWAGGWVRGVYYGPDETPPQINDTITVQSWSLHTLRGHPTLKLEATGEKCYQVGDVVSHEDFNWLDGLDTGGTFRGEIRDVRVAFTHDAGGTVKQHLEIAVTAHAMIQSGAYKPRSVVRKSAPVELVPKAMEAGLFTDQPRSKPTPKPITTEDRKFDFTGNDL